MFSSLNIFVKNSGITVVSVDCSHHSELPPQPPGGGAGELTALRTAATLRDVRVRFPPLSAVKHDMTLQWCDV